MSTIRHKFDGNFDPNLKANSVSVDTSNNSTPFNAEVISQLNSGERNLTLAMMNSTGRHLRVFIDKNITEGPHEIGRDKKIFVELSIQSDSGGQWTYHAKSGNFLIIKLNNETLDAHFNCEVVGGPENETIKLSNGLFHIIEFKP